MTTMVQSSGLLIPCDGRPFPSVNPEQCRGLQSHSTDTGTFSAEPTERAVAAAWATAWSQLRVVHPDVEDLLAQLELAHPTRFRSLQRLEASAARCAGRVLRGEATAADLQTRLERWRDAVLAALEDFRTPARATQVALCRVGPAASFQRAGIEPGRGAGSFHEETT
jgi:hypothetical protein